MFRWFKKKQKDEKDKVHEGVIQEKEKSSILEAVEEAESELDLNQKAANDTDEKKEPLQQTSEEENGSEKNMLKRFALGITKTRKNLSYKMNSLFLGNEIDDDFYDELEEILVMSDMGAETTMTIIDLLKDRVIENGIRNTSEARNVLKQVILEVMQKNISSNELVLDPSPAVILMVGVNGVGKTTTAGKLAYQLKNEGKSVMLVAADTFRAAAIEQLEVWGKRAGVHVVSQKEGADPAAVVFDGLDYASNNNIDITIIDTAGRLHNKVNLMNELNKIKRTIDRKLPNATMEVILALDATTGQNALLQVQEFKKAAQLTGVSLNKLDGTAKGGVIIPIQYEAKLPVKIIGVGEQIYDLQPFDPTWFVEAIFS
ncbi:MAG: signal recognition particle-docking protein FtsY [Tissierellia bacterium]|nr:signal recognition particle-docking protein FtsY [Tissierellia bacterium]